MNKVELIAITKPVKEDISISEFIAYVARVSNRSNQRNYLTSNKLLKYLNKHKEFSPFEMANMVVEVDTTRDISRQILRHRSFSFQEFSQRYAVAENTKLQLRECRLQDTVNRQNSIQTDDKSLQSKFNEFQASIYRQSNELYQQSLELGIAKEQARCLLPEGLTSTRLYINGNIRSWIHYIQVRTSVSTQKEHRKIAEECKKILLEQMPVLSDLF